MPNYANGRIYKIYSLSTDEIYIGSTTEPLSKRMTKHRSKYKQYQNGKGDYFTSFKILEYGDAKIELIEQVNCKCREELVAREGYFIRTLDCVNKRIEDRTGKEYAREYRKANKDKLAQYYEANREKIAQYNKEYRKANKEKIIQIQKQYYEANKARNAEKVTCECGTIVTRGYLPKHKKTKKHLAFMNARN